MSDAIGALSGLAAAPTENLTASGMQETALTQQVSPTLGVEFNQAIAREVAFVPERTDGAAAVGHDLNQKLEGLSSYLNQWGAQPLGQAAAGTGATPATADPASTTELVAQIQATYTFAIETTLVSKGSTETTKIFNTLLKGQ